MGRLAKPSLFVVVNEQDKIVVESEKGYRGALEEACSVWGISVEDALEGECSIARVSKKFKRPSLKQTRTVVSFR